MIALFLALLLALVTAVFALQNTDAVTVRLLFWDYHTSLVLVILGAAGVNHLRMIFVRLVRTVGVEVRVPHRASFVGVVLATFFLCTVWNSVRPVQAEVTGLEQPPPWRTHAHLGL